MTNPRRTAWRTVRCATVAATLLGLLPSPAIAEPPGTTGQAAAAQADFLEAQGAPSQAGVCLIDTGVDINPDTETLRDRLALGAGEVSDTSPSKHGTRMAALIAGRRNQWGTIGLWPAATVVSIRAAIPGTDHFGWAGYINGIDRCHQIATFYGLKVISLALGTELPPVATELEQLEDRVAAAHERGFSVVAAAGNAGADVQYPAQLKGVLSVGAADGQGGICAFSARPADLYSPGCGVVAGLDPANGLDQPAQGTSEATSLTSAALAALRAHRPDLTWSAAESLLLQNSTNRSHGPELNVRKAFEAAGIAVASPAAPATTPGGASTTKADPLGEVALPRGAIRRLKLPIARLRRTKGKRLEVRALNRPRGINVRVDLYRRSPSGETVRVRRVVRRSNRIILPSSTRLLKVTVVYLDPNAEQLPSRLRTLVVIR